MVKCSFCGREEQKNLPIVEGAEANICKECASVVEEQFMDYTESSSESNLFLKPHEIKARLDEFVVEQEEAKRLLSVAVYNHYKRIHAKQRVDIQKSNVMVIGPTGSGKTHLIQTLANIIDVPLVITDATNLTASGYVGEDVDSLIEALIYKSGNDIKRAEKGIIFIDEVDKIASSSSGDRGNSKDVGGRAVQEGLLKMIEGSEVTISIGASPAMKKRITINTKNILFVFGGAFVGLDKIIENRNKPDAKTIGFQPILTTNTPTNSFSNLEIIPQDLVQYGLIPEFVGRIPIIAQLNPLTVKSLSDILTKPKNAILKQYQELLRLDGVRLKFNKCAVEYIAKQALERKVGARGLKGVIEKQMYDLMYRIPQYDVKQITITKEMIAGEKPILPETIDEKSEAEG